MGVFVRDDDLSDFKFFVRADSDNVDVLSQEDLSELPMAERRHYDECHVQIKPLGWGKACDLQSEAMTTDGNNNQRFFDSDKYVKGKLRALVKAWSFTEKNEKEEDVPVQVTPDNIDVLHSAVADYILKEYNDRFELTEKKRKSS